jgi:hypothetical protein
VLPVTNLLIQLPIVAHQCLALSIDVKTCSFEGFVLGIASLDFILEGTNVVFEFLDVLEIAKGASGQKSAAFSEGFDGIDEEAHISLDFIAVADYQFVIWLGREKLLEAVK